MKIKSWLVWFTYNILFFPKLFKICRKTYFINKNFLHVAVLYEYNHPITQFIDPSYCSVIKPEGPSMNIYVVKFLRHKTYKEHNIYT